MIEFRYMNPHSWILLTVHDKNGSLREWIIKGPRLDRIHRMGIKADFLDIGDSIQVCEFIPGQELIETWKKSWQKDRFLALIMNR